MLFLIQTCFHWSIFCSWAFVNFFLGRTVPRFLEQFNHAVLAARLPSTKTYTILANSYTLLRMILKSISKKVQRRFAVLFFSPNRAITAIASGSADLLNKSKRFSFVSYLVLFCDAISATPL